MKLNTLMNNWGAKRSKKRVGRGIGSGKGKTCGRGVKGQKSRSGVAIKGFEGGQMPIIKRLPKRGFNCPTSKVYQLVDILLLNNLVTQGVFNGSEVITKDHLVNVGVIKKSSVPVKLLSDVDKIECAFSIQVDACSQNAKLVIEKAGGKIIL